MIVVKLSGTLYGCGLRPYNLLIYFEHVFLIRLKIPVKSLQKSCDLTFTLVQVIVVTLSKRDHVKGT